MNTKNDFQVPCKILHQSKFLPDSDAITISLTCLAILFRSVITITFPYDDDPRWLAGTAETHDSDIVSPTIPHLSSYAGNKRQRKLRYSFSREFKLLLCISPFNQGSCPFERAYCYVGFEACSFGICKSLYIWVLYEEETNISTPPRGTRIVVKPPFHPGRVPVSLQNLAPMHRYQRMHHRWLTLGW